MNNKKEIIRKFLFFSKNDGKKIHEKLDQILENQEKMKLEIDKITKKMKESSTLQKEIVKNHSKLAKQPTEDTENIYQIINQLLLKELLKKHKDLLQDMAKKQKRVITNKEY